MRMGIFMIYRLKVNGTGIKVNVEASNLIDAMNIMNELEGVK